MSRIPSFALSSFVSSIMTSTDHGAHAMHTVCGQVVDDRGQYVNGADVLIVSAMDRRHLVTAGDGRFITDICVNGICDEIFIRALFGAKLGIERVSSHGMYIPVNIVIKDRKLE